MDQLDGGAGSALMQGHPERVEDERGARACGGEVAVDQVQAPARQRIWLRVRQGVPRRLAPQIPWARISRSTRPSADPPFVTDAQLCAPRVSTPSVGRVTLA